MRGGRTGEDYKKYDHELVARIIASGPISLKELIERTGYPKTAIRGIINEITYSHTIWEEKNNRDVVYGMMKR